MSASRFIKCVTVGDGAVGKTCLLISYTSNTFPTASFFKKVSKHKRGIRNGPKALKLVPVIIRCRSCGRVKLPHFFCCSGERGNPSEQGN